MTRVHNRSISAGAIVILLVAAIFGVIEAQDEGVADDHRLAPFARIIGGEWHTAGAYSVFEWGPGQNSIIGQQYHMVGDEPTLVSQGMIFYHPGDDAVRAYFTATGMGIDLFDYTMTAEGDKFVSQLETYGQMSGSFEEVWEFTDDDHYEWALYQLTPDGKTKIMSGAFERR